MTKERLGSPRARLFVALELPTGVRATIAAWQAAELRDPALRAVDPAALHVTLCFLGYLPERRIPEVEAILARVEAAAAAMRLEPEVMPIPTSRPKLLALGAPSEGATDLAARLSAGLAARGLYEPERRDFWSHVTVARVRPERRPDGASGRRRRGRPLHIENLPGALPDEALEPFECVRTVLYRSNLRSHGAEYVALASTDLMPRPETAAQKE